MDKSSMRLLPLLLFAVATPAGSQVDEAVAAKGNHEQLQRLRGMQLPPEIAKTIASHVRRLSTSEAMAKATEILRLDLAKRGFLNASPGKKPVLDAKALRAAFPDELVLKSAATAYNDLATVRFEKAQATPGTATEDGPTVGLVGSQTVPGTQLNRLTDCNVSFDAISKACGPVMNGIRCETFSRSQFPEVAKIVLADGVSVCSGTLVADRWVLSAAHCFLETTSAAEYVRRFPDNKTASGDAVMKGASLYSMELHLPYSRLDIKQRRIDMVIVNRAWDPAGNVAAGDSVKIADKTIAANYAYPGDLALIRINDADAIAVADVQPATLARADYQGVITTAGYGYTTAGDGKYGELWVTWPEPPVVSANSQLELQLKGGPQVSTFCRGDSGGPAFEGRHRGCPPPGESRPRELIGVTSYFYGSRTSGTPAQQAAACMASPIMRFVNVAAESNRRWLCKTIKGDERGC